MDTLERGSGSRGWFMPVKETSGAPPWELARLPRTPEAPVIEHLPKPRVTDPDALSTCYADIEPEDTDWVWEGKLPLKDVVLGAGDGGIGKGLWVADVAARVTNGEDMPDDTPGLYEPRNVILVTPEDHIRRTMAWRIRAAGADPERIHDMTTVMGHDFTIPDDIALLKREIERIGNVGLVVIDPLSQVVDKNLTSVKFVRRSVWAPLKELAETTGCCIMAMHHLTKAGSVAGSAALVQAARLLLRFSVFDLDPELVKLVVDKTNIGAKGPELFYARVGDGHDIHVEYREMDIQPVPEADATMGQQRILYRLSQGDGPMDAKALAEATGMTYGSTRVLLGQLFKEGLVTRAKRGQYVAA